MTSPTPVNLPKAPPQKYHHTGGYSIIIRILRDKNTQSLTVMNGNVTFWHCKSDHRYRSAYTDDIAPEHTSYLLGIFY